MYGRKTFERLTASGHEEPPAAEPLAEVYSRVSAFYEECVVPLTAAGKNVLVVSHQYALEPLALYLAGKARAVQHCGATPPCGTDMRRRRARRGQRSTPGPWTCPTAKRWRWRT